MCIQQVAYSLYSEEPKLGIGPILACQNPPDNVPMAEDLHFQNEDKKSIQGDGDMSLLKKLKNGFCLTLSASLVSAAPAQASWKLLPKATKAQGERGGAKAERLVDITMIRGDLQKRFWQVLTEIDELESGGSVVPGKETPEFSMENGSGTLSSELAESVIREMFQGQAHSAQNQWLSYRDLIFIMTYFDVEGFVKDSDFFRPVLDEFARLNLEDQIGEDDDYASLLAAMVAYERIRTQIDASEKLGSAGVTKPLKDAIHSYFPMVISQKIKKILSESLSRIEEEGRLEAVEQLAGLIDAENEKGNGIALSDNALENGKVVLKVLKQGFRFLDVEKMENLLLAARTLEGGFSEEELRQMDLAMSEAVSKQMTEFVSEQLNLLQNRSEHLRWNITRVEMDKRFELRWITEDLSFTRDLMVALSIGAGMTGAMLGLVTTGNPEVIEAGIHPMFDFRNYLAASGVTAVLAGVRSVFVKRGWGPRIQSIVDSADARIQGIEAEITDLSPRLELVRAAKTSLIAIRGRTLVCEELMEQAAE